MSWFSSWDDFTKKASEVAKSASEKAAEAAKVAADKSKVIAAQVNEKVNQFVEEQKKEFNAVEQETDLSRRKRLKREQIMSSGHPPWHIDEKTHAQQIQFMDELRLNILKLCEDENNFLIKAPTSTSVFDFKLEYALPYAQCALREDPVLPDIRFKMVPKKLTEEQFWKNYFYRVNVIRESLNIYKIDFSKPPIANIPRSRSPSGSRTEQNDAQSNNDKNENTESKQEDNAKDENQTKQDVQSPSSKTDLNDAGKTQNTANQAQSEQPATSDTIRESLNIYKIDFSKPPIANIPRSRSPSGSRSEKNDAQSNNDRNENTESKQEDHTCTKDENETKENAKSPSSQTDLNNAGKTQSTANQAQSEQPATSDTETKSEKQTKPTTPVTETASASATNSMPNMEDNGIKMDLSSNADAAPSSEHITEMPSDTGNDLELNEDDDQDEFLSDELHIDSLTNEERAKKMKELGIDGSNDVENVDDLLAGVNMDNVEELSDGELEKELKNIQ
eukprot:CAMPEP_0197073204 /NCGR_PEP_ID=MMETSP1384-20130603/210489_1 /TAXON_ID=29189 /ORGANISM="Ammonia sp." /LENGTH=504 /DNA_ID=CAMNT_0042512037 /DNA_START=16 /DNA_END=1530 /DNA_ORIENTATION=-